MDNLSKLELSPKAKKALEADYFKAKHKKMLLETKLAATTKELSDLIKGAQAQMDGLESMLGYKPVQATPATKEGE
jgi:hypothetical protein